MVSSYFTSLIASGLFLHCVPTEQLLRLTLQCLISEASTFLVPFVQEEQLLLILLLLADSAGSLGISLMSH